MVLKICVVTLSQGKPMMLRSVFTDGILVMSEPETFAASRNVLIKDMIPKLCKYRQSGFKVLVDEVSGEISKAVGAHFTRMSDKHTDGRPVIVVAIERYEEMKRTSAFITPKSSSGFDIPNSLVDRSNNSNGEVAYNINWGEVRATHLLTILSVYATFYNNPGSADYIAQMATALNMPESTTTKPDSMSALFGRKEEQVKSLSGEKLGEDYFVL